MDGTELYRFIESTLIDTFFQLARVVDGNDREKMRLYGYFPVMR